MKIKKVTIEQFRGFKQISFEVGTHLTAIAGQNGTQKTTALGILSQTFALKESDPMYSERPLCGGNFKSAFSEKFKLSEENDKPKCHEWTLYLDNGYEPYTIQSIARSKESNEIRFWKKGDKGKGSGYLPLPVIYLSLSRLIPIGEDNDINISQVPITDEEKQFCKMWHKKILLIQDNFEDTNYLESKIKNTLGVKTVNYDWKQNSAGQDNIGKILLAILSFMRLKKKYPSNYQGGILAIDELEATLYPASQEKLIDFLSEFSDNLNLQVFFTTHSLEILKKLCPKVNKSNQRNKIVFFKKEDNCFKSYDNFVYEDIVDILNATSSVDSKLNKLKIYCEDEEARCFAKQIFGTSITKHLSFEKFDLGNREYVSLVKRKIPEFGSSNCIILLDGDFQEIPGKYQHILNL
jgi:AAA15 family ATPase/GTPase